jgi:hypothetical protein
MTAKTPEGRAYQTQLSRGYALEAWQATGGDPANAARYYYGGPNRKIWGANTNAYAQNIMARLGAGDGQLQGGTGADPVAQGAPGGPSITLTANGGWRANNGPQGHVPGTKLTPQERLDAGFDPSDTSTPTWNTEGNIDVREPQFGPTWVKGKQDAFMKDDAVNEYRSVISPTYQSIAQNIGKMSGPATMQLLDGMLRTFNPGASTRQGTIDATKEEYGVVQAIKGKILRWGGKGSMPLDLQQDVLDAVAPLAINHYKAAKQLSDSFVNEATQNHVPHPEDAVVPLGDAPERYVISPGGRANPESFVLGQARQQIKSNPRLAPQIRARLQALKIDPARL